MKTTLCHPDKPHCAKGLCRKCYDAKWKRDKRRTDPAFKTKSYAAAKAWHVANPAYERERSKQRRQENPDYNKDLVKRWWKLHPEKRKEYKQRYRQVSRDKYLAQMRANVKKRKARMRGTAINTFTTAQWEQMKEQHNHTCYYCGNKPSVITQDHKIPISRGGAHEEANIVPACMHCNVLKGTKTLEEFI